ncbi:MAG: hypothetical protein JW812_00650 [Alphaproteobacteria bacterium]|nr:hypothetical protein [Alphaproteobacteria bacterium]MBN2779816.1 hypothetical protein [Alphaproteobacteria bacterium]
MRKGEEKTAEEIIFRRGKHKIVVQFRSKFSEPNLMYDKVLSQINSLAVLVCEELGVKEPYTVDTYFKVATELEKKKKNGVEFQSRFLNNHFKNPYIYRFFLLNYIYI